MRIVTYNTCGSLGRDGVRSTPRIAQAIQPLSPDIVCFQEIQQRLPQSGGADQPELLSKLLQRPLLFQRLSRTGPGSSGLGIAIKGTVRALIEHMLPSVGEQCGALQIRLREVGGIGGLTVFCTQWGSNEDERQKQAEFLVPLVEAAKHPLIFCGCLNKPSDASPIRTLLEKTGLADAGAHSNYPTFQADSQKERLDYILYSPDLRVRYVEVVDSLASAHSPLLADFERV